MPTPEQKLEALLQDFQDKNKTDTTDPGKTLREWLDASPAVKARMADAVDKGLLVKIEALPADAHAGGSYSAGTKTMKVPIGSLNDPRQQGEITFVLGHEIEHAHYGAQRTAANDAFNQAVKAISESKDAKHDYTKPIADYVQFQRENEGNAHLGGFNAIVSKLTHDNGKAPTLKELYQAVPGRMQDFIDRGGTAPNFTYTLKPGLTQSADMTLASTKENLATIGKIYFDAPAHLTNIGKNGNQDYPTYYADAKMDAIDKIEKAAYAKAKLADPTAKQPEIEINLRQVGATKSLLTTTLDYVDTSPVKRDREEAPKPVTPAEDGTKKQRTGSGSDEPIGAAEHARGPASLQTQADNALIRLGIEPSGADATRFANMSAMLALQAQRDGLTEISGALKGKDGTLIAYQGDPASDHVRRSVIDMDQAGRQPAAQSVAQLGQLPQAPQPVPEAPVQTAAVQR
jgi:hypothetical protein